MKSRFFFLYTLVVFFASCAHENKNIAIIHSEAADSIFKEIHLVPYGGSANYFSKYYDEGFTFSGGTTFSWEIDTVECRTLFSRSNGNFWTSVFVTPGDSVSFKTVNNGDYFDVIFEGKNAAHYNYESEKRKSIQMEEPYPTPEINPDEYKKQLQAYRAEEEKFLMKYKDENKVSREFIDYASAEINNKFVLNLYSYVYLNKCKVDAEKYLLGTEIIQNPLSHSAIDALFYKYVICASGNDIVMNYNAIQKEVITKFRPTLTADLVIWFAKKGDVSYKSSLYSVMNHIEKTSKDSILLATVKECKPFYSLTGTVLPDSILDNTQLLCYQDDKEISLRQFFKKYENSAIYLDFWASWCGPCRMVNAQSAENKHELKGKGVNVVYISVDDDKDSWKKAVKQDGIQENQYLLLDEKNSPLNNYLQIRGIGNGIPRFVLFNKKHEIVLLNAPHPVDCTYQDLKAIIEKSPDEFVKGKVDTKKAANM